MNKKIYLSPPHLSSLEKDILLETIESNWIAPFGPNLDLFEKKITDFTGAENCCLTNSGTAAIHLALRTLAVGVGDFVLAQTHTHIGSINPIIYQGAIPVFIDSEGDTFNMDPEFLEIAIRKIGAKKIKAILVVHIYGMPAKMAQIMDIAHKYEIPVIEDAAESMGSTIDNKMTGTFGDLGIFSFNGNKIITTGGGGALISNKTELISQAKYLANQAKGREDYYHHEQIGYNYTLSNVLAGIGLGQISSISKRIEQRRLNYSKYFEFFDSWRFDGLTFGFQKEDEGFFSNRWLTSITTDPKVNNGFNCELVRKSLNINNIEARHLWKPMHLQPVFAKNQYFGKNVAENLFKIGLCLPSGSSLKESDFERIFNVLSTIIRQHI